MSESNTFTKRELQRVGAAVLLIAVLGTIIILGMTIAMGHYNSLAHAGPKAAIDGIAIGLLIGRRGRWRLLGLVGIVYGLVLLCQVGLLYLLPIMTVAGVAAAAVGRVISPMHRPLAIAAAVATYELLAGTGGAVRIVFGTRGDEPLIWALWIGEEALRALGGVIGVVVAHRMLAGWSKPRETELSSSDFAPGTRRDNRQPGVGAAALRLTVLIGATILPLSIRHTPSLCAFAGIAVAYALWAGLRRQLVHLFLMFLFGWLVFSGLSIAWHQDLHRVTEIAESLVLRFLPMTLSAAVLVETTRSVDLLRCFRAIGMGPVVLLPLSHVVRQAPVLRREWFGSLRRLRLSSGGRFWLLRRPREAARLLIAQPFRKLAAQLIEA